MATNSASCLFKYFLFPQGMHNCITTVILRYTDNYFLALLILWTSGFYVILYIHITHFLYIFKQNMQKLWAEEIKFTSFWRNFSFLTSCINLLCGICHCVGYKATDIIFMGWTRYSCKFHLLIHANKFRLLTRCYYMEIASVVKFD